MRENCDTTPFTPADSFSLSHCITVNCPWITSCWIRNSYYLTAVYQLVNIRNNARVGHSGKGILGEHGKGGGWKGDYKPDISNYF